MSRRRRNSARNRVRRAFNRPALKAVCEMHELDFPGRYPDLGCVIIPERKVNNFYYYADRGSDILFMAHLDTVVSHENRMASFVETKAGPVIHSGALDDRLGAYIGLELLPSLGLNFDVLLLVGEESGQSTAEFFTTDKQYNWMIEFDRKETDVVMYCYDDYQTAELVRKAGARVGHGSFSDVAELEHLGIKGFNWGCGYTGNYHTVKGYAYLEDTYTMVAKFMNFHAMYGDVILPHEKKRPFSYSGGGGSGGYYHNGRTSGPRSSIGSVWVAGKGWLPKDEAEKEKAKADQKKGGGVVIGGVEYASYDAWWNATHPGEEVDAEGNPKIKHNHLNAGIMANCPRCRELVAGDKEAIPLPGPDEPAHVPMCERCKGAWGADPECDRCTFWDGSPRPWSNPGPLGPVDREPVGQVDDPFEGLSHPWDNDVLDDLYSNGGWSGVN